MLIVGDVHGKIKFQFQSGTIKGSFSRRSTNMVLHFNSNLVRLKAKKANPQPAQSNKFQFQSGTIKGLQADAYVRGCFDFNSNLVRLKGIWGVLFGARPK